MNMLLRILLFLVVGYSACTPLTEDSTNQAWLSLVKGTSWTHNSQNLHFNSSGSQANIGIYLYTYDDSNDVTSGIYFTQIEMIPIKWFLLEYNSDIIQYGPFLHKEQITKDTSNVTVFTRS